MRSRQSGFTLIEIAIVLLIVIILLGYTVAMFPLQQELKQYRQADAEMEDILEHLVGYAQVNGRLPCPDTILNNESGVFDNTAYDGREDTLDDPLDGCETYFGFLPARTLGISGRYDDLNRLLDPWGNVYRYAVSNVDSGDGNPDLVVPGGMRAEGLGAITPSLTLCNDSDLNPNEVDTTCGDVTGTTVIDEVAVVIISRGKEFAATSDIQRENVDNFEADPANTDQVFIFAARRDDYDDIIKWISPSRLFSKMIEADQLP